jgi:hypothetical protein
MALRNLTIRGQFAAATAILLAASSTKTRYLRFIQVSNNVNAQRTWNYAVAATCTAAGPGVFGEVIAPNARAYPVQFGPKGSRVDNTNICGFADAATSVSYEINYDESDTLDA